MVVSKKANQEKVSSELLATLALQEFSESFILNCAQEVFDIYKNLGGMDKVAKGSDLIKEIKIH